MAMVIAVVVGVLFITAVAQASTTIDTSITTGGNLSVTGNSTLTGTLGVTGLTTMVYASSTSQSLTGNLLVGGMATTTGSTGNIATQGTLAVGTLANAITSMTVGQCVVAAGTTIAASTTAMVNCTTDNTISTSDRIFMMATSSLASNFIIQAASSTTATNIQVRILNVGLTTSDGGTTVSGSQALGAQSFNYWALR